MEPMKAAEKRKRQREQAERQRGKRQREMDTEDRELWDDDVEHQETVAMLKAVRLARSHGEKLCAQLEVAARLAAASSGTPPGAEALAESARADRRRVQEAVTQMHDTARMCIEHTRHVLERQAALDRAVQPQPSLRYLTGMPLELNDSVDFEKRLMQLYGSHVLPAPRARQVYSRASANSQTLRDESVYEHRVHITNAEQGHLTHDAPLQCILRFGKRSSDAGPRRKTF